MHDALRAEFIRLMTEDSGITDGRRKGYNQAIFAPQEAGGWAVWSNMTLDMVMDKFDRASKNVSAASKSSRT
jgi:hypothetical protein